MGCQRENDKYAPLYYQQLYFILALRENRLKNVKTA